MELYNLQPAAGATHNSKRVGRGYGSGKGRTSTRGHKGAKARSGYKKKIGFEGGQIVFLSSASRTSTTLSTRLSTLKSSRNLQKRRTLQRSESKS